MVQPYPGQLHATYASERSRKNEGQNQNRIKYDKKQDILKLETSHRRDRGRVSSISAIKYGMQGAKAKQKQTEMVRKNRTLV
jgi:hypothetical protein